MSSPSQSEAWRRVRALEDVLALLAEVDDQRRVIRIQAWHEGSWERVYLEATAMRATLARMREILAARWEELIGDARDDG
jgi:hypothetical protein